MRLINSEKWQMHLYPSVLLHKSFFLPREPLPGYLYRAFKDTIQVSPCLRSFSQYCRSGSLVSPPFTPFISITELMASYFNCLVLDFPGESVRSSEQGLHFLFRHSQCLDVAHFSKGKNEYMNGFMKHAGWHCNSGTYQTLVIEGKCDICVFSPLSLFNIKKE